MNLQGKCRPSTICSHGNESRAENCSSMCVYSFVMCTLYTVLYRVCTVYTVILGSGILSTTKTTPVSSLNSHPTPLLQVFCNANAGTMQRRYNRWFMFSPWENFIWRYASRYNYLNTCRVVQYRWFNIIPNLCPLHTDIWFNSFTVLYWV